MKSSKFVFLSLVSMISLASCSLLDGLEVIKNPEKTHIRQTYEDYADNAIYTMSTIPTQGSPKLLVIPVAFTDTSDFIPNNKREQVRTDINTAFFGEAKSDGWNSVSSYYEELSSDACKIEGVVTPWIETGESYEYFAYDYTRTVNLVNAAVNAYFTAFPEVDRKDFDLHGKGYLDGVCLIYGCPEAASLQRGDYENLWGYTTFVEQNPNKEKPVACGIMWASYDFMYSASKAYEYFGNYFGIGDTLHCDVDSHCYIHEVGHMFGLDDYYDYSGAYSPAGGFSMQDMNVGSHDPFSVMALGWADPYIPTESCTIKLGKFQKTRELILLTNEFNTYDSPFDEYLLLEFYSPDGLNKFDSNYCYRGGYPVGPKQIGIRLWHVDARLVKITNAGYSITSNARTSAGYVVQVNSNTYNQSVLGEEYNEFYLLDLIHNQEEVTYNNDLVLTSDSLFKDGSSFTMSSFKSQFQKRFSKLNNGEYFEWSFSVSLKGENAIVELTREE